MAGPISTVRNELQSWYKTAELLEDMGDMTNVSLPNYAKKCSMIHKVYIQRELSTEENIYHILSTCQNMIAAWAICAVQQNINISSTKTLRKLVDVVATESFKSNEVVNDIVNKFRMQYNIKPGLESSNDEDHEEFNGYLEEEIHGGKTKDPTRTGRTDIKKMPIDMPLPQGRIIEIEFSNKTSEDKISSRSSVEIWLQLMTQFIPAPVMEQFVAVNFKPTLLQRWLQFTSGEIRFLQDFIGQADRLSKRRKALKNDKNELLKPMQDQRDNSISKSFFKAAGYRPQRQNIATSILLYDRYTFNKICSSNGCNFKQSRDRQRFFDSTMCMMVIVVDSMHNLVDFYINGLDTVAQYSFDLLKQTSKQEKMGVMDIMQAMAKNQAPRF